MPFDDVILSKKQINYWNFHTIIENQIQKPVQSKNIKEQNQKHLLKKQRTKPVYKEKNQSLFLKKWNTYNVLRQGGASSSKQITRVSPGQSVSALALHQQTKTQLKPTITLITLVVQTLACPSARRPPEEPYIKQNQSPEFPRACWTSDFLRVSSTGHLDIPQPACIDDDPGSRWVKCTAGSGTCPWTQRLETSSSGRRI